MADQIRLVDDPDGSQLGRALIASAADDGPSSDQRGAAARRLGIAGAALLATGGTEAGAGAAAAAVWWKVGLLVIALGGVTAVAVERLRSSDSSSEPVAVAVEPSFTRGVRVEPDVTPAPAETPIATVAPTPMPAPSIPAATTPRPITPPVTHVASKPVAPPRVIEPVPAPEPAVTPEPTVEPAVVAAPIDARRLAAEVAVLDRARAAVRAGDTTAALAALDEHDRSFADGALTAETHVIRIETLIRRGDRLAAAERARAFLANFPHSPLAKRVRSLLDRVVKETP